MGHRHKKKGEGGGVAPKHDAEKKAYTGAGSNVEKEAEEKKVGGKVKAKATGGPVKAEGKAAGGRLDKRARGGGIHHGSGKDMTHSPFSAAHVKGHMGPASHPHVHKGK